ncbi:TolC family protein [Chryseobacterium aquaticum]|uniref:TolC family protein n=1 Tax=Chryseobacterium aquaticum TaxID=452084 RepID=A0A848NC98_9FLAO|nr:MULTISPECIES: TolC family protein [Chryseobacterium]NMR36081.1 TolC family protein [Chryseobacterium aquaticum]NRQ48156.1 TolC family protein [Chryseobacterium sp. C-204]
MQKVWVLILTIATFQTLFSQDTISISKPELEQKILGNNLQVKMAEKEAELADVELLRTRAMYLPNINASYTFSNTNNPLYAFGSRLNQERITMTDFNPDNLNSPKSISNFATKLEIQQPIINMDAVYQKKAGQVKSEVLKIKTERTKEYVQFELKKAYMTLQMAYKMVETLENARTTTLANKKVIDNYYKNGIIQKSEVLYMDVRLKEIENQIHFAKSNVKNASDYLYFLFDEDYQNKVLKPTESLEYQENIVENNPTLDINRKDLQAYQKSLEAYDLMIKSSKAKFLPKLNAFGSFEMYDNKIAQFDANGYLAGIQLSWNVFDGLKAKSEQQKFKAELSKVKTEIQQYQKQSELELNKTSRQVQDAQNKVNLTKLAWEQSKEAYRIRKNRYDQGLEKSADLLTSETQMSQKELEHIQAIFEYNTTLEYYKFLKN